MRYFLLGLCLLFTSFSSLAQEFSTDYKSISYSEFFKMTEEETDTVFRLKNTMCELIPHWPPITNYEFLPTLSPT